MEARSLGPEPKASLLLKPDRSPRQSRASGGKHLHQLVGTPSCFTPHHATGAGKTGRGTGVNGIASE